MCADLGLQLFSQQREKAKQVGWEAVKNALPSPSLESCPKWEPAGLGCSRGVGVAQKAPGGPPVPLLRSSWRAGKCTHGCVWETGKPCSGLWLSSARSLGGPGMRPCPSFRLCVYFRFSGSQVEDVPAPLSPPLTPITTPCPPLPINPSPS